MSKEELVEYLSVENLHDSSSEVVLMLLSKVKFLRSAEIYTFKKEVELLRAAASNINTSPEANAIFGKIALVSGLTPPFFIHLEA